MAASYAIVSALTGEKTLAIDMDGGKALARVFQIKINKINETQKTEINNLSFAAIQNASYIRRRGECETFDTYIKQFPEDYWLIAYNDMLNEFFWASTDTAWLHKFISLVKIVQKAKKEWFQKIIIDIEPTSGFERLINWIDAVSRSVQNLSKIGLMKLAILWTTWPDIAAFLKGDYIKKALFHASRLMDTKDMILWAKFSVVSIPEPEPLEQALGEVVSLIDNIQGNLTSVILNNCWRLETSMEKDSIKIATSEVAKREGTKLFTINHNPWMFNKQKRLEILEQIGNTIVN